MLLPPFILIDFTDAQENHTEFSDLDSAIAMYHSRLGDACDTQSTEPMLLTADGRKQYCGESCEWHQT